MASVGKFDENYTSMFRLNVFGTMKDMVDKHWILNNGLDSPPLLIVSISVSLECNYLLEV